ncbi:Zinc finger BED domain-containing protein 5-like [Oopsacas minuta]|uniref:Zinc finger BED domain-containing protein 5-like n=1 Tax=Oopsacas minuta TaxID=111878 RepID=A0AAV7KAU6_9METZ|nr:Zinc finger BED domain-containing protein 5-like [Oopsacas minuta]
MKPSLLKKHLSGCHPELVDKDAAFLKGMEIGVRRVRLDKSDHVNQISKASLRASYMVALRIAQEKTPHTIVEKLILHCCKDIVRCLTGDDGEKKICKVPPPTI